MPARAAQSPRTTTVPPRIDAAAPLPALPSTMTVPESIPSATPQPALPRMLDGRAVAHPAAVVADAARRRSTSPGVRSATPEVVPCAGVRARSRPTRRASAARIARLISRIGRVGGIDLEAAARRWPRGAVMQAAADGERRSVPQLGDVAGRFVGDAGRSERRADGDLLVGDGDVVVGLDGDQRLERERIAGEADRVARRDEVGEAAVEVVERALERLRPG